MAPPEELFGPHESLSVSENSLILGRKSWGMTSKFCRSRKIFRDASNTLSVISTRFLPREEIAASCAHASSVKVLGAPRALWAHSIKSVEAFSSLKEEAKRVASPAEIKKITRYVFITPR